MLYLVAIAAGAVVIWGVLGNRWDKTIEREWEAIRRWEARLQIRSPRLYEEVRRMADIHKYYLWRRWRAEASEVKDFTADQLYERYHDRNCVR